MQVIRNIRNFSRRKPLREEYVWDFDPSHCPKCGGKLRTTFVGPLCHLVGCEKCKAEFLSKEIIYMSANRTRDITGMEPDLK